MRGRRPWPRSWAGCVAAAYAVVALLRAVDGLTLYLAYPGGDGDKDQMANGAGDLARAMEAQNAALNVSVAAVPLPCDGSGERLVAQQWAIKSAPPAGVIGGCCDERSACQNALSQILFGPQRGSPTALYMYPSLESASEAIAAFAEAMKWRSLLVVTQEGHHYARRTQYMLESLTNSDIYSRLTTYQENTTSTLSVEPRDFDGLVWLADCAGLQRVWQRGELGDATALVPLPFTGPQTAACLPADYNGFVFVEGFNELSEANAGSCARTVTNSSAGELSGIERCLAIDAATAMAALLQTSTSSRPTAVPRKNIAGLTGDITFSESGNRRYNVTIRQYVDGSITRSATYNGTELMDIDAFVASYYTQPCNGDCSYAANVIACLLGAQLALGVGLAVPMMAFNWVKRKDRMIKLTSPNLNIVMCTGCVCTYVSIVLLGLGEPWIQNIKVIAKLKQAGAFLLSASLTVTLGSVFLKTWRVYRIFSKPQSKGTVARDEHLLLMLCGLLMFDVIVHVVWLTTDPYQCTRNTYAEGFNTELHYSNLKPATCSAKNANVWYALLCAYKLALLSAAAYCAFRIRHVSHPSLNDSSNTFASAWTIAVVGLSAVPLVLRGSGDGSSRYELGTSVALILDAFLATTTSLLWQFVPKIGWTVKNKGLQGQLKFRHAIRLKQSNTPEAKERKRPEPPSPHSAAVARSSRRRSSERGAPLCNSLMRQELECLNQKLKEKDDTIRELTDRLFFGAEHFRAYVERKAAASTSAANPASAMLSSPESASLSPACSVSSSSADADFNDGKDGVFAGDRTADFHNRTIASADDLQHESAADGSGPLAAVIRAEPRRCRAADESGTPFDAVAALRTGLYLNADCIRRYGVDDRAAVKAARPIMASLSSGASTLEQLSPCTDDEPDSGVYTASVSEKGFRWLTSSHCHRSGAGGSLSDSEAARGPLPPRLPLHGRLELTATVSSANTRSIFLVDSSREDVATDV